MKNPLTIGIVGGMSPESTVTYYQQIVRAHQTEFQRHDYPRIVIASVSFQKFIDWQHEGDWSRITEGLEKEFEAVAKAGADFAILATNTMHKILPDIKSKIPVLSVLDAVGDFAKEQGIQSVGLTGTRFTMSDGFYARGLEEKGLKVILPTNNQQDIIHQIIYEELIQGKIKSSSINKFAVIAESLLNKRADVILLGCTELELLTRENSLQAPTLDSTRIHAEAAWKISIGSNILFD